MKAALLKIANKRIHFGLFKFILAAICLPDAVSGVWAASDIARSWFTPPVIPTNYTEPIRFEATALRDPATVTFQFNGVDRPMHDDGTHGDLVAGDGTWTLLFQPEEILGKLSSDWVYRPFIGYCKPAGGPNLNVFAEIWSEEIGLADVEVLGPNEQATDYLVNFTATISQLMSFNASYWANRFYSLYGDNFDFLVFLHVAGKKGNRHHLTVKNDVQGIGRPLIDDTAKFGSSGRLKGCKVYPLSAFFDLGETAFNHEVAHQWINYLADTPFSSGISHWPKGDVAINIMGFSTAGGVGGNYSYAFTPDGLGGFVVGPGEESHTKVFNPMELYLMGLVPPSQVGTFFILNDQELDLKVGQTLHPSDITLVTVQDIINVHGPRIPASAQAQKTFRSATVVLSEQLLDVYAMSFYDWFARRGEAKQPLSYSSGFAQGSSKPFYLATGGRAVIFTKMKADAPHLEITPLPSGEYNLSFTGKPGIQYQPQVSVDCMNWIDFGPVVRTPLADPPGDAPVSFTVPSSIGRPYGFYRLGFEY